MHFHRSGKTVYYYVITVLSLCLLKHSLFIITSLRFIRKSLSAYNLDQTLLATFLNPLPIKLNLCGGRSKNCSKQKIFCMFVIMQNIFCFEQFFDRPPQRLNYAYYAPLSHTSFKHQNFLTF